MRGDPGPYMDDEGGVWVPQTVPWKDARRSALTGVDYLYANQRLKYVGKTSVVLVGFARDCDCEEVCCGGPVTEDGSCSPLDECRVPAWAFQVVET